MKKLITNTAVCAVIFVAIAPNATASLVDQVKTNAYYGKQINQDIEFSGNGNGGFKYDNSTEHERTLTYFKNEGNNRVTYRLTDPKGYEWQSGTLDPGMSYVSEYTWEANQSGLWVYDSISSDGGTGKVSISVKFGT